jgi:hypothetical protein
VSTARNMALALAPAHGSERMTEAFRACCETQVKLVAAGHVDLHTAVDRLQTMAEAYGLVALHGQDCIQAIMAAAFGRRHT